MTTFGTIRPKPIAKMIVTAVMPSEIVAARSSRVVFEPLVSSTRPLVILKRKTPGIIDNHRREADRRESHMPAMSDGSEDQTDDEARHERADRRISANGKSPPPQGMSENSDHDRPPQHSYRRREEDAVSSDGHAGGDHVEPGGFVYASG